MGVTVDGLPDISDVAIIKTSVSKIVAHVGVSHRMVFSGNAHYSLVAFSGVKSTLTWQGGDRYRWTPLIGPARILRVGRDADNESRGWHLTTSEGEGRLTVSSGNGDSFTYRGTYLDTASVDGETVRWTYENGGIRIEMIAPQKIEIATILTADDGALAVYVAGTKFAFKTNEFGALESCDGPDGRVLACSYENGLLASFESSGLHREFKWGNCDIVRTSPKQPLPPLLIQSDRYILSWLVSDGVLKAVALEGERVVARWRLNLVSGRSYFAN